MRALSPMLLLVACSNSFSDTPDPSSATAGSGPNGGGAVAATTGGGMGGSGGVAAIGGGAQTTGGAGGTASVGGGGSAPAPCFPQALVDGFEGTSVNTMRWTTQGASQTISISGGLLHLSPEEPDGSWVGLISMDVFDHDECSVWVRVPSLASNGFVGYTYFQLFHSDGKIAFEIRNGMLEMVYASLGHSIPYVAQDHHWLRIRDGGDDVHWETSADGMTWTIRHTAPAPPHITAMTVGLGLVPGSGLSNAGATSFDNLNETP